jgi:hypothetical protein
VEKSFEALPGWSFAVEEITPGSYRVQGRDIEGRNVSITGGDPEKLLDDARAWAVENADSPPARPDQTE